jgi:hypothetical protein
MKATTVPGNAQGGAPATPTPGQRASRLRDPNFWGAMAGMAVALVIACIVVAAEMVGEFGQIASHFRRRADHLQARVSQMEARLNRADREVAEMRSQAASHAEFDRILAAPDAQLIRLEPPAPRHGPGAALVVSQKLSAAALDVANLPPVAGHDYQLWWIAKRGAPVAAIQFNPTAPDQASGVIRLPIPRGEIEGAEITLSRGGLAAKAADPQLRGVITRTGR